MDTSRTVPSVAYEPVPLAQAIDELADEARGIEERLAAAQERINRQLARLAMLQAAWTAEQ